MYYTVPVVYTTSGWIRLKADNRIAAITEATRLNEEGIEFDDIHDAECHSEVMVEELELEGHDPTTGSPQVEKNGSRR